jgi:hypothetical protein
MTKVIDISHTSKVPPGKCVECGYETDHASGGKESPEPGDASLCIMCGSLSIFADDLTLRAPTVQEMLRAAADRNIQTLRRAILMVREEREAKKQ